MELMIEVFALLLDASAFRSALNTVLAGKAYARELKPALRRKKDRVCLNLANWAWAISENPQPSAHMGDIQ